MSGLRTGNGFGRPLFLCYSARSEIFRVYAGELTHVALDGIENGGGHASMSGGLIGKILGQHKSGINK